MEQDPEPRLAHGHGQWLPDGTALQEGRASPSWVEFGTLGNQPKARCGAGCAHMLVGVYTEGKKGERERKKKTERGREN